MASVTLCSYTLGTAPLTSNPLITSLSYHLQLASPPIPSVGSTNAAAQVSVGHTDGNTPQLVLHNTATLFGAGYFYQGTWNMIGTGF